DTSATREIVVYPVPVAAFESDRYNICIGQSIQLTNNSDAANSYAWDFGDGGTSVAVHPTYVYSSSGTYTIRLVTYRNNPSGDICTDTAYQQIVVTDTLPGSFSIDNPVGMCVPYTVTFTNETLPSVLSTWDF